MKNWKMYVCSAAIAMTAAQPMTAMAAGWTNISMGNKPYQIVVGGGNAADIKKMLEGQGIDCDNLQDLFPGIQLPGQPDLNRPGQNRPDVNLPGQNQPEQNRPEQNQPGQGESNQSWEAQVLELVNQERAKAGLNALQMDERTAQAASVRAQEITRSFSHTRPDGSNFNTALQEAGVSYTAYGENIAYGQSSPQQVMNQWMNSAGHRANILNPNFTAMAVGHTKNASGTDYWVQLFIR